ncbi:MULTISPECIES: hypothetical protein [Desulfobacula]|uniref:Conserved uncharacterized protein n=2 Tax=Desulfobacula TaxID=28222 RepID=K0NEA2_DESTT|nr:MULTISPECIES: hypothetical protein [Desulfobacula]CCK79341.1 conserved uncharacterized protein [Desulfobacula toluolica Tol2]SDT83997.1 hypothetical protein SAMN04487931_10185 [Desulfobacula phenolica]
MTEQTKETWYYIVVQNPGTKDEQFVGYTDKETNAVFIPAFATKEIAMQCFLIMPKDIINEKYEPQAIIKEDLLNEAQKNGYDVFLLDHKGSILEKIS